MVSSIEVLMRLALKLEPLRQMDSMRNHQAFAPQSGPLGFYHDFTSLKSHLDSTV